MAILVAIILVLIAFNLKSIKNYFWCSAPAEKGEPISKEEHILLHGKAKALCTFAKQNGYDTNFCFLIDMKMPSGLKRFFIYDFKKEAIVDAGLVAHGRCNGTKFIHREYNNVVGGGCTSLGKYKIGNAYHGQFGLAYKLHGLDSSNSNAFIRYVVLHSHECVPNNEVAPYPICQSDGCPTVSPDFLSKLASFIDKSKKPMLLEIFDEAQ